MKKVLQIRLNLEKLETISLVHVLDDGIVVYSCYLMELPWRDNKKEISCIPEGTYPFIKIKTGESGSRIKYPHFWVRDVPSRSGIKWHVGNYVSDLRGCGAPGLSLNDMNRDGLLDVTNSKKALNDLLDILPGETTLTILHE